MSYYIDGEEYGVEVYIDNRLASVTIDYYYEDEQVFLTNGDGFPHGIELYKDGTIIYNVFGL